MGPKTSKVYETLRARLSSSKYGPGGKLPSERTLVDELGIGRTALRQVLARLVAEGYLEVRGRSSYRVPGVVSVQHPEGVEPWLIHGERDLYDNRWVKLQLWDVEPPGAPDLHGSGGSGSSGPWRVPRTTHPEKESSPWLAPRCSSSPKSSPKSA